MNYKKLIDLVKEENLSDNKIARVMDMSGTGYRDMLKNKSMKVDTLEKVANHFKVPVSYFFEDQPGAIAELVHEPKAAYKNTGCYHCAEKERLIAQLENRIADKEQMINLLCKKETGDEDSTQFGEDAKGKIAG